MEKYTLSPNVKNLVSFCYRGSFILWAFYFFYFCVVVTAVAQGWLEKNDEILIFGGYPFAIFFAICVLVMACYAMGYVLQLWIKGYKKEAMLGLMIFFFLNIITGYLWFYWSEIKQEEIRFKLL